MTRQRAFRSLLALMLVACAALARADAARWQALMAEGKTTVAIGYVGVIAGNWTQGVRVYQAAVHEAEQSFGPYDPRLAASLEALAALYLHSEDDDGEMYFALAERCILRAKAIRVAAYGPHSPRLAPSFYWLGHLQTHVSGESHKKETQAYYQRARAIAESGLPANDPLRIEIYLLIAPYYADFEGHEAAMNRYVARAVAIAERAYAVQPEQLADVLCTAAEVTSDLISYGLNIYPNPVSDQPPAQPTARLRSISEEDFQHVDALLLSNTEAYFQRAAAVLATAYGKDDPRLAAVLLRQAGLRLGDWNDEEYDTEADRIAAVEALSQRAADIFAAAYGANNPAVNPALWRLAECDMLNQRTEAAWEKLRRALANAETAYGVSDPRVLDSLLRLAAWSAREDPSAAEALYQRAVDIAEHATPPDEMRLMEALQRQAVYFADVGRIDDARANYQRALALIAKRPGATVDDFFAFALPLTTIANARVALPVWDETQAAFKQRFGDTGNDTFVMMKLLVTNSTNWAWDTPRTRSWHTEYINLLEQRDGPTLELATYLHERAEDAERMKVNTTEAYALERRALAVLDTLPQVNVVLLCQSLNDLVLYADCFQRYADVETYLTRLLALADSADEYTGAQLALAGNYRVQQKYREADATYQALFGAEKEKNLSTTNLGSVRLAQAECFLEQGKLTLANEALNKASALVKQDKGHWHARVTLLVLRLDLYGRWGKTAQAEAILRDVLGYLDDTDESANAEMVLDDLCRRFREQGRFAEEAAVLQRRLQVMEGRGVKDAHYLTTPLLALAKNAAARRQPAEMTGYLDRVRALIAQLPHTDEQRYQRNELENRLLAFYGEQRLYAEAEAILRQRLADEQAEYGAESFTAVPDMVQLAALFVVQQKYSEAEKMCRTVLQLSQTDREETGESEMFEPEARATLLLAQCSAAQGRPAEAERLFASALAGAEVCAEQARENSEMFDLQEFITPYAAFLRTQGRERDAATVERRLTQ